MAVIFMDGFEYATGDLLKRWTTSTNTTVSIQPNYARSGGCGLYLTTQNAVAPTKLFGATYTSGLIGFAWKGGGAINLLRPIMMVLDGATEQCSIRIDAGGRIVVCQGSTVKATGTTPLVVDTWYYIEFKFTIHQSTGIAEVKLNGASEIASTGSLDLTGSANNWWDGIALAATNSGLICYFDDIYVLDTTTGSNVDFLGPVSCLKLGPAAPGATSAWTPNGGSNYGCVNDTYQDGDNSFNQSSTANQVDTFVMQDMPATAGSVYAVQTLITARQDLGAARSIAPVMRPVTTDHVGTTVNLSTAYQTFSQIYDLNPEDSAAWEPADVAGMEVGYKLIA